MPEKPWKQPAPRITFEDAEARRRYARAGRLTEMERQLGHMRKRSPEWQARNAALIDYRVECLANWQAYVDGWTPPKPTRRKAD